MPYQYPTDRIAQYEDWPSWGQRGITYRQFIRRWYSGTVPEDTEIEPETTIAYINEGRWFANCPTNCGGAMVVTVADPLFFCTDCGQGWFTIEFPEVRERNEIERLLMLRPLTRGGIPESRNWFSHETIDDLEEENRRHGL